MRGWHEHDGWGGSWWWLPMTVMMVLFWGGLIVLVLSLWRRPTHHAPGPPPPGYAPQGGPGAPAASAWPRPTPQEILAERLARGEIEPDDYHRRVAALQGSAPAPAATAPTPTTPPPSATG